MSTEFKVGDKVRLTGDCWAGEYGIPKKGGITVIAGIDDRNGPYITDAEGDYWYLGPGYEWELVGPGLPIIAGGFTDIKYEPTGIVHEGECHFPLSAETIQALAKSIMPYLTVGKPNPKPDFHPNFVQVYLETQSTYVETLNAARNAEGVAWVLQETHLYDLGDIDLMRLLLDEIEDRMLEEEE